MVAPVVLGLKFGVRTTVVLYLFEVVLLLVLAITVLAKGGAQGLSAAPFKWPSGSGTKDIFIAFSFAVLAFGGFEAAAPLAEETRNPRRNVPLAVIGTVVVSGILYVFCSYALMIAFGTSHIGALASDPNPFHTAAARFIAPLAPLITWIFLTSVTSSYVAANTQTARVIFAGARGGLWPRGLAAVSPRFRTPWAAAIAFVAPSIAIGVISTAFTDPGTAVGLLSTYGILGLVLMYLMANIALIVQWSRFRRAGVRKNPWAWVVTPVIGVLVLAIPIWGDLRPGQPAPYSYLPWLTIGLIAAGIIYMLALQAARPRALDRAVALLEGEVEAARPRSEQSRSGTSLMTVLPGPGCAQAPQLLRDPQRPAAVAARRLGRPGSVRVAGDLVAAGADQEVEVGAGSACRTGSMYSRSQPGRRGEGAVIGRRPARAGPVSARAGRCPAAGRARRARSGRRRGPGPAGRPPRPPGTTCRTTVP